MSVNAVDQTTGNTTPLAGNTNNLVGNLSALTTNTKSDAVGAINEVNANKQNATDNNLQTTNKNIVGGINELVSGLIKQNLTFTPSENVTVAYGYVKKQLDVVNLFLQCQKVLTLDGWDQIGRLPEGARPQHNIYIGAVTMNKDGIDAYIECQVAANGYVWVYPKTGHESAVATNILINSTFIV